MLVYFFKNIKVPIPPCKTLICTCVFFMFENDYQPRKDCAQIIHKGFVTFVLQMLYETILFMSKQNYDKMN